jgi:hypothetical protein
MLPHVLMALAACPTPGSSCAGPAPRPLPDWGDASFTVSGEDPIAVEHAAGGVVCDGAGASVRSGGAGVYWALTVMGAPPSVWWSRRDQRADAVQPGPTWVAREPPSLRVGDGRVVLADVAVAGEGGAVLRIEGEVRCPIAADPVSAATISALGAAAGGPAARVGERARAAVPVARLGAVVDATRGRVGRGVVVWAGAVDGDAGEVWVAPGSGPFDVVRHAGVGGPDAPWIAAEVERLAREHRIDLVAAEPTSLTARLPQGADAEALAREVAALCPAVLDAPDASIEALATQLERDRQLVCWWDG